MSVCLWFFFWKRFTSFESKIEETRKPLPQSEFKYVYDVLPFPMTFQKWVISLSFQFDQITLNIFLEIKYLWKLHWIHYGCHLKSKLESDRILFRIYESWQADFGSLAFDRFKTSNSIHIFCLLSILSSILPDKYANPMAFQWCAMGLIWYICTNANGTFGCWHDRFNAQRQKQNHIWRYLISQKINVCVCVVRFHWKICRHIRDNWCIIIWAGIYRLRALF